MLIKTYPARDVYIRVESCFKPHIINGNDQSVYHRFSVQ